MIRHIDKVDLNKVVNEEIEDNLQGMLNFEIKTENNDDVETHPLTRQYYICGDTHDTVRSLEKVFGEIITQLQFQDINRLQLNVSVERLEI